MLIYLIITTPKVIISGVLTGIEYSVKILVPSLFPLMFLSKFIVNSQILDYFKKYFNVINKFLFYLPGSAFPAIILSIIGGYPVGAICAKKLFENKEINSEQLNRLLKFTVNSGPGFVINFLGFSILKNQFLARIILFSQILTSILIGIISGVISRIKHRKFYHKNNIKNVYNNTKLSEVFVDTVSETSNNIINICFIVIIFTCLIFIINYLNLFKNLDNNIIFLIQSFLEITSGICFLKNNFVLPEIISFMINYGGLCTHFQIISILKNTDFNYINFNIFKIISSSLSAIITKILLNYFEVYVPTFLSNINNDFMITENKINIFGNIFLFVFCIYFTLCVNNKKILK